MRFFIAILGLLVMALHSCVSNMPVVEEKKQGLSYRVNQKLYDEADSRLTEVKVSLWDQKAWLLNEKGQVLLETDVSTGIDGRETPARSYTVLEKLEQKRSNRYGRYVSNETGEIVVEKAWEHQGGAPEGTVYRGIAMPYWMRLTWYGIGMHVGGFEQRVRTSFGCIRVYEKAQPWIYKKIEVGSKVEVVAESLLIEMAGR